MMTMCSLVILLVLYLLIKTFIISKKKDYGILKALGYTSKNIIVENAISFMPSIILSVIMVIFMGIGFVILSFVFALMLSLRIKKIEPYKLLNGD